MMDSHSHTSCCGHKSATTALHQTVDEMEFERGIWKAAIDQDLDRIEQLLSRDSKCLNKRDNSGYTAMHYAARAGNVEICRYLLNQGAEVNAQLPSGDTPLHRACYTGKYDVIKLLIHHKARAIRGADGQSILHKACDQGHYVVAELVCEHFPDLLDQKDDRGRLPSDVLKDSQKNNQRWKVLLRSDDT